MSESPMATPAPRWELHRQFAQLLRRLRWAGRLLLFGGALMVLAQIASVYRLFRDVHPVAGWVAALTFAAALAWFVGRPVWSLVRVPRAVRPPRLAPAGTRTAEDWKRQRDYIGRYLRALRSNPELDDRVERIDLALDELHRLRPASAAGGTNSGDDLTAFEREHVLPLLTELDARVDALIQREALAVGTMTAVSPNGSLDVFLVLWRNVNMVATIARLYYGRPGLRGTALVAQDVASAVLLASVMEKLSDMSAGLIRKMGEGSRAIPLVGALVGPTLDGVVNAIMTMKLGYLARERCRSFEAWDRNTTTSVLERSFRAVSLNSRFVLDELVKAAGGPVGAMRATADAGRDTVQQVSGRTFEFFKGIREHLRRDRDGEIG